MTNHPVPREGFRWTCPYCGASRLNKSGESEEENAVAALRAHILATDGSEHGPKNEYPDGYGSFTPSDYVRRVARGRDPIESAE